MKIMWKVAGTLVITAAFCSTGWAQWSGLKDAGVPRNPDGTPNLTAPTPRMPDGKPDFSGIWQLGRPGAQGQRGQGQGARGAAPAGPPAQGNAAAGAQGRGAGPGGGSAGQRVVTLPADGTPPVSTFGNIGAGIPGGPPLQPWAAELLAKRRADNDKDNPDAHCLPMGFMQFHNHPEPRKIVQTPQAMYIIYEANSGLRQIYMDGRKLPGKDAEPWWYGYSVGHWEGDTLVVETTGFKDGLWLDVNGDPLTEEAKVTEKFRRPNFGTLEIDVTIDDPKAYTKPFTVRVNQHILVDTDLIEFICEDRDATHYVGAK